MTSPEGGPSPTGHSSGRGADQARLSDIELIERVRAAGPGSAEAKFLSDVLLEQGLDVLRKLNGAKKLISEAQGKLRGTMPPLPKNWSSVADSIIYLAVSIAVKRFMQALFDNSKSSWQPNGEASLRTYFVNGCLLSFTEVYRKDHAESNSGEILCADVHEEIGSDREDRRARRRATDDPESRAIDADRLRRVAPQLTDQEKKFVVARAEGSTCSEIGDANGMTGDAVSSKLGRMRNRIGC
jgi:DNA-binding CsgD family transcriptional regulator